MGMKQGYKQTEIGVIPEDWNAIPIGEFLEFKNGLNKGKEFFGYGTPIVNYTDTYKKRALKRKDIEGRVSLSKEEIRRFEARQYDVFFTRTSETPDEVGLSSVLLDEIDDCVFSGFILRGRPKNNLLDPLYCKYCFSTKEVRTSIITGCTYTTRALTNGKQLSGINIFVPPLAEQKRIAEALSDVDELIVSLEKLIEKRKALKQGVMQELLTGKRRLPGFTGEWITSNQLFEVVKGEQINGPELQEDLPYPLYNGGVSASGYTSDYNYENRVIISEGGNSCGYINYIKTKFWAGGHCYVVVNAKVLNDYLYQLLKLHETNIMALRVGSGLPNIQKEELKKLRFSYPKETEEQQAIVKVLYDIDLGIRRLTDKLDKVHKIKSGMMSELLTGRIRLRGMIYNDKVK